MQRMKNLPIWTAAEARVFLQAMNEVGSVGGIAPPDPIILEMMRAIQKHVLHSEIDISELEILHPPAYPALLQDQTN